MGLSNKNSGQKFVKVHYEGGDKDSGTPTWGIQDKVEGKWEVVETGSNLTGKVVSIEKDSYDYRGQKQHKVKIGIKDGEELFMLELGYGYYSRNILNTLAGIGSLSGKEIDLSIYRKDTFVSVFTTCNGEKTEWMTPAAELPKKDTDGWLDSFEMFINLISGNISDEADDLPY